MIKKTVGYDHEFLMNKARRLYRMVGEGGTMERLLGAGVRPQVAYLIVKAVAMLDEPYVYRESKTRIVDYGEL